MSYDRKIDQICPHTVVEEALLLGNDRRTIRPLRPIASSVGLVVRMDGAIDCPSPGVLLPASVVARKPGNYTVAAGSQTLRLMVNQGEVQTLSVTPGERLGADHLAAVLSRQARGAQFFVQDRRIGMRTDTGGRGSSLRLLSPSPLGLSLGLPVDREVRGLDRVPPWTLVRDQATLSDRPTRLIVFDDPLPSAGDYVEVTYTTVQQECRRCGGVGVEYDWRYGATGEVVSVVDEALLIQEVQKIIYTLKGSNPFHTGYGTSLLESVGKKQAAGGFLQNLIATDVADAFRKWQSIKQRQEQVVGQPVSDREYPFRLLDVDLVPSQQDPTIITVSITIQNRSFDPIVLERGIRVPEPMNLLGSTQNQGIMRQSLSQYTQVG